MASSTVSNCTRNIIQLATISFMLLLLTSASAHFDNATDWEDASCGDVISSGSALERNLKMVMSSLVENVNKTGYNTSSYGENGDKMYGLAQCRGDLNASTCRACASEATKILHAACWGLGWASFEGCFLRYDTHNFYSQLDFSGDAITGWCNNTKIKGTAANATKGLDGNTASLLTTVMLNAGSINVGFGTGNKSGLYSLAQCWRDLGMGQCGQCLSIVFTYLSSCPSGTIEGEAYNKNCILRFGREKFYGDGVPLLSPSTGSAPRVSPTGPSRTTEGKGQPKIMGLIIGGAVISVVLVAVVVICKRKISKCGYKQQLLPGYYKPVSELSTAISKSKLNYKFQTLQIATKNFIPTNKIGQGGFGSVYKGVTTDNREIAIKRLFINRGESVNEFFNEVNLISHVQHKNLVKLLGCSVDGPDKLLVYEYLPNKSLDHFLFEVTWLQNILFMAI